MANKNKKQNGFTLSIAHEGKTIVSRHFTTDQYNNEVRHSINLNDIMADLVDIIQQEFKRQDYDYMYENYNLSKDAFNQKWKKEKKEGRDYQYSIGL